MSKNNKGLEAFHNYYREIYSDDWESIVNAFLRPKKYVALENIFVSESKQILESMGAKPHEFAIGVWKFDGEFPNPSSFNSKLLPYYLLDEASMFPVSCMEFKPNQLVLDLCSAPGGKALALFFKSAGTVLLTCNELSQARRQKLARILQEYIPANLFSEKIKITGRNANTFGLSHPEQFDHVLCDVPCSSERHLVMEPKYLNDWSKKRTVKLSQEQFSILCSAVDALKPDGELVYSTCSVSPLENQNHLDKLILKRKVKPLPVFEDQKFKLILPNIENSSGPIFCFKVKKVQEIPAP
jgi:16S rRNA C967 or C1407 C5-methylase (RsmB/RsmF family)